MHRGIFFTHQCNIKNDKDKNLPHLQKLTQAYFLSEASCGLTIQVRALLWPSHLLLFTTADLTYAWPEEVSQNYERNASPRVLP